MFPANIKNIIFDFGGVIYDIAPEKTIQAFKALNISKHESFAQFLSMHSNDTLFTDMETGKISAAQFRLALQKLTNVSLNDKTIDLAWNAMLIGYQKERLDLLLKLKKKYRTFLLSNTNIIHWEYFTKQLSNYGFVDLQQLFEKTYYSFELGMKKPDSEIFQFVLKDSMLIPSETVFLDDNASNISTARALGIPSIQINDQIDMVTVFENI